MKQKCILENSRISDAISVFWELQSSSLQVRVTQTAKINYFLKTLVLCFLFSNSSVVFVCFSFFFFFFFPLRNIYSRPIKTGYFLRTEIGTATSENAFASKCSTQSCKTKMPTKIMESKKRNSIFCCVLTLLSVKNM